MKYKVGDKFEIEVIAEGKFAKDYYVTTVGIVNEAALDRLNKIEPEDSEVDWSKIAVDTPILVKHSYEGPWRNRYFAKYEDGKIYAWNDGTTSWTAEVNCAWSYWTYAKLAEVKDEELEDM